MERPKGEMLELGLPSGTIIGKEVWRYREVASTNDELKELASSGAPEGCCVVADSQTKGKGRLGRTWVSPPDVGLYLSCLVKPSLPPESLSLFTLLAGGAVAQALGEATGLEVKLKWPNDLLHQEKKLGGVLTELTSHEAGGVSVVMGIGVNINTPPEAFPPEVRPSATSLRQAAGKSFERLTLLKAVLLELDASYAAFRDEGPGPVLDSWRKSASTLGRRVRVELSGETVEGHALGLTETGQLLVRTDQGLEVVVLAGDVVHLKSGSKE